MFTKSLLSCGLLGAFILPICAQDSTKIDLQYLDDFFGGPPPTNPLVDELGIPLDAGTAAAGDGDIVEIGYFSGIAVGTDVSTFGSTEWLAFTPITSTPGATHLVTIGDSGGVAGNLGVLTVSLIFLSDNIPALPAGSTRLGVRFFNDTDPAGATHYNTVTSNNGSWVLEPPATPQPFPSNLNMDDPSGGAFFWEDNLNQLQTSIALAPEPTTSALLALGALSGLFARRRRS